MLIARVAKSKRSAIDSQYWIAELLYYSQGVDACAADTPSECLETLDTFYTTCGFPSIEQGMYDIL